MSFGRLAGGEMRDGCRLGSRDPRSCLREENDGEGRVGERSDARAAAVTSSNTSGPTSTPTSTNTITGVTGVPVSSRDTPATASAVAATIASSHFILLASTGRRREPASPTLDDTDRCAAGTVDPCASATSSNLDDAPPSVAVNLYA